MLFLRKDGLAKMSQIVRHVTYCRHAGVSLEFAVLAAFIGGMVLVVSGAVGGLTLQMFGQVKALF